MISRQPFTFRRMEIAMVTYLQCKISPGQFTGEFAVHGESYHKEAFSLFVSEENVDSDRRSQQPEWDGWVRVEVLAKERPLVLVQLPGQTFENGTTITVHESELCERNPREIV